MDYKEFLKHFPDYCIQTFDDFYDRKDKSMAISSKPSGFTLQQIQELNKKGAGIYFSVNKFPDGIRKKEYCKGINAWFAESDNLSIEEQQKNLDSSKLKPSFIVRSKNSLHAYWLAKDGTKDNFILIQDWLKRRLSGDPTMKDYTRVLRIPGFYHMKDINNPFMVEIVSEHPERIYTEQQMIDAFVDMEEVKREQEEARLASERALSYQLEGGNDVWDTINKIPIEKIVADAMGWNWDGKKHWYAPGSTQPSACFKANDGNYVVHGGTSHFPDTNKGYSPFNFVKMINGFDDKQTFEWFKKEYPEVKEVDEEKRKEWIKKQNTPEPVENANILPLNEGFKATKVSELRKKTPVVFPWLVDGLVPEKAITVIAGDTGCGKSLFNLYMADRISQGKDLFDDDVKIRTKQTNVLYIDREMVEEDYIERTKLICSNNDNMFIAYENKFKIDNKVDFEALGLFLKDNNIGLVVFDTLSKIHSEDENSNTEITKIMEKILNMCNDFSVSVVLIHHHNKNKEVEGYGRGRGASAIPDNCASYLTVKSQRKVENGVSFLRMVIEQHKSRRKSSIMGLGVDILDSKQDGEDKLKFFYRSETTLDSDKRSEAKKQIYNFIVGNPLMVKTKLLSAVKDNFGIGARIAEETINELVQSGMVVEEKGGQNRKMYIADTGYIQDNIL